MAFLSRSVVLLVMASAVAGCGDRSGSGLTGAARYRVEVTAQSPSFTRTAETETLWSSPATFDFGPSSIDASETSLGNAELSGLKASCFIAPADTRFRVVSGVPTEEPAPAPHERALIFVLEDTTLPRVNSDHTHGTHAAVPNLTVRMDLLQPGTSSSAMGGPKSLTAAMGPNGLRYFGNVAVPDGSYDLLFESSVPAFLRDGTTRGFWSSAHWGGTTIQARINGATINAANKTLTFATSGTVETGGIAFTALGGAPRTESGFAPSVGDTFSIALKAEIDDEDAAIQGKLAETAYRDLGRLPYFSVSASVTNTASGEVRLLSLEPAWDASHGFHYVARTSMP